MVILCTFCVIMLVLVSETSVNDDGGGESILNRTRFSDIIQLTLVHPGKDLTLCCITTWAAREFLILYNI